MGDALPPAVEDIDELVDLARYPLHRAGGETGRALIARCRADLRASGVCLLPGFLTPAGVARLSAEAAGEVHRAFFCHNTHNAYLAPDDPALPIEHARRRRLRTDVGSIAGDYLPRDGAIRRLYAWDPLTEFVGAVLGYETFYRAADPLGAVSVNVFTAGGAHAWHFDESSYTVTLMLQEALAGGHFEYVAKLRTAADDNVDGVGRVLDGEESAVARLPFLAGTLFVFAGRNTLHRVTPIEGDRPRLVGVFCYSPTPGMVNSDAVRKLFWGRTRAVA